MGEYLGIEGKIILARALITFSLSYYHHHHHHHDGKEEEDSNEAPTNHQTIPSSTFCSDETLTTVWLVKIIMAGSKDFNCILDQPANGTKSDLCSRVHTSYS